nr:hypothetical protein [Clostridia bacterium]
MKNPIRHGKRWMSFLLVLMLTVGLVAAPAFAASETIENPNGEWESLWNPYFGQVFTPTQNTTVTGASFVIRSCWPHPSSDVTLVITTMNGAILDTSDTVTVGSEYSWVDFTFAGGVRLNAGTSYIVATLSATRGLDARYSAWFDYMG